VRITDWADDEKPTLTLPKNLTVGTMTTDAVVNFTVTAYDKKDGALNVTTSVASGSSFPVGLTTVNATVTDNDGNTVYSSFTVNVKQANHIENFENGLTGWTANSAGSTPILGSAKTYDGNNSLLIDEDYDTVFKTWSSGLPGKVASVWYYDENVTPGGTSPTTYKNHTRSVFHVGKAGGGSFAYMGVDTHNSINNYVYRYLSAVVPTGIPRTKGWHEFKMDFSDGTTIKLSIDGVSFFSVPNSNYWDVSTVGTFIMLGDQWDNSSSSDGAFPTYYDNLMITDTLAANSMAPIIATTTANTTFTEGQNVASTPVVLDNGIVFKDADTAAFSNATVSIAKGYAADQDTLLFANDRSTMGDISGSFNSTSGVLTFTSPGDSAMPAQWQAALRAVKYLNNSDKPVNPYRLVTFSTFDGTSLSSVSSKFIIVNAVNDLPVLTDSVKNGTESNSVHFSATDYVYSDADSSLTKIKILTLPANGTLKLNGTAVTAGQEIQAADIDQLSFVPDMHWNGTTSFTWNGYDGMAFAASAATVAITVSPDNTITASAGNNGSISPDGIVIVAQGTDATYTITPESGYMIDTLTVDGTNVTVTSNTFTFMKVTSNHTIDVTFKPVPPAAPIQTNLVTGNGRITLNWLPSSNAKGYIVKYGAVSGTYTTTLDLGNVYSTTIDGLQNGTSYYFAISAYNSTGESGDSNEMSGLPDGTPPTTQAVLNGVKGSGSWFVSDVTVTLPSKDDNSGVASTEYALNVIQSVYGPQSTNGFVPYHSPFVLTNGIYELQYRSTDRAGNIEASNTITVNVDKTAPTTTITVNGSRLVDGATFLDSQLLDLLVQPEDDMSGVVSQTIRIDGVLTSSVQNYLDWAGQLGTHVIQTEITDLAGNVNISKVNVNVTTNESSMQNIIEKFVLTGELKGSLEAQITNKFRQALDQLSKGHRDQAIKHMQDVLKQLEKAKEGDISAHAKQVLTTDANAIISAWSRG
jgi:hypothetical protein